MSREINNFIKKVLLFEDFIRYELLSKQVRAISILWDTLSMLATVLKCLVGMASLEFRPTKFNGGSKLPLNKS
ncbi:hypothetical protein D7I46_11665 [Lactococcus allomyrinae]|uniref:Uncharacterized protein n=1 Tax=Lactococcus allomyrinae TaxID=2419773 RepID=A0A387BCV8_9LACT|nr:hypothetical protein D7I46_11665 [Lactococcus allomyrinae]